MGNRAVAQKDESINDLIEQIIEGVENSDFDLNYLQDKYEYLIKHPININKCEEDELRELSILTDQQIFSFFKYRNDLGKFYSIYEIQAIPLFDLNTAKLISNFITIGGYEQNLHISLAKMFFDSKKYIYLKSKWVAEQKNGFISKDSLTYSKYAGNKFTYYSRFKLKYSNRLDIGFIAEKDPGEIFAWNKKTKGFDFYTGHIFLYKYKSWLKELNLGDYSVSLGQGLILHNDFARGKSSIVTMLKKNSTKVIRPFSSVNENLYFRGIGATFNIFKNIELSLFASRKKIDASIGETVYLNKLSTYASSLQISGFHRTESEIDGKNSIKEIALGSRLNYRIKHGYIGMNFYSVTFDKELIRQDKLYNKYRFSGNKLTNGSIDYSYLFNRILFYGELARSKNNSFALLQGIQYVPSGFLDIALLYRKYSKGYESINSNAFGEKVGANNEEGVYLGLNWHIAKSWTLSLYHDIWRFSWFRYGISSPSFGSELFLLLKYSKRHKYSFYTQFKYESSAKDVSGKSIVKKTLQGEKYRIRFHFDYKISKAWRLRNRVELSYYSNGDINSKGSVIYQDIIFKPIQSPFSFTFRYALFDTDDYSSAIYAYENDILGEVLIPAYTGKGFRSYINLKYQFGTNLTTELRYAKWYFPDKISLGTGNEQIDTNHKTDIKIQVRYSFN